MTCDSWSLCLDVISFNAALSASKQGGQWRRVAPLLYDIDHRALASTWSASTQPLSGQEV
eukprot:6812440-Karenia_brevis.AAC.1